MSIRMELIYLHRTPRADGGLMKAVSCRTPAKEGQAEGGAQGKASRKAPLSPVAQGRRRERREEYRTQRLLIQALQRHLDPSRSFYSSLENLPRSPIAAYFQRLRGVKPGLPDLFLVSDGRLICIEIKS